MKHLQLLILANHQEMSPLASPFDLPICFTGFVRSLEFLKKSRVCPAIFQTWKKSGRIVKVWIFFFFKPTISYMYLYLSTLSLEKINNSIVLEKVWKKSWILDAKICTNPFIRFWVGHLVILKLYTVGLMPNSPMIYLSNRPHFLWVYWHDNPCGMLGEHKKSLFLA